MGRSCYDLNVGISNELMPFCRNYILEKGTVLGVLAKNGIKDQNMIGEHFFSPASSSSSSSVGHFSGHFDSFFFFFFKWRKCFFKMHNAKQNSNGGGRHCRRDKV